jgi:hypothetical protein
MLDRSTFNNLQYNQYGNWCVLASYGVSSYPFTDQNIQEYYQAYCDYFLVKNDGAPIETRYELDFSERWQKNKVNGYEVILELFTNSSHPFIVNNRRNYTLEYISDGKSNYSRIEQVLKSTEQTVASIFIGKSNFAELSDFHSITVAYDVDGFFIYDVNHAGVFQYPRFSSIMEIGEIADAFLFTKK